MPRAIRKPLEPFVGSLVKAYLNLHLPRRLSVRAMEGASKGVVIGHPLGLVLSDCRFIVSEAGRQRVLREKCKNVHAGVVGKVSAAAFEPDELEAFVAANEAALCEGVPLRYNPYETPLFCERDSGSVVHKAESVILIGARMVGFKLRQA